MRIKITHLVVSILFFVAAFVNKATAQGGVGISYSYDTSGTSFTLPTINAVSDLSSTQTGLTYWNSSNDTTSIVFDSTNTKLGSPAGNHYHGFTYGGILYRGFYVSTNGFIGLTNLANGSTPWTNGLYSLKNNNLATTAGPILAPLWDDLLAGTAYQAKWDTTTAGGPFLWIRFVNMKWSQPGGPNITFWIRLTPATQKIDFIYPANAITPTTPSASIGIIGPCAGDYYSVKSTNVSLPGVDSLGENCFCSTSIVPGSGAFRMISFTPRSVPPYDNCANAKVLPNVSTSCTYDTLATTHATTSGSPLSCASDVKDVWVKFVKPIGVTSFDVNTVMGPCQALAGVSIEVDSGTCASLGTPVACSATNSVSLTGLDACSAHTYYARITGDADAIGKFKICVQDPSAPGATCATANPICSLPYNSSNLNTSGFGNDYTSANTPCASPFHNGLDYVFSYTPSGSECDSISITGTGANSNPAVFVYDGCPDAGGTNCIASATGVSNTAVINKVTLTGGTTYYIVVDNNPGPASIPFLLHMYTTGTVPTNDECASIPAAYDFGNINPAENCAAHTKTGSNECSTSSTGPATPACGSFVAGISGDVWYKFTSQITGTVQINLTPGSSGAITSAGMAIYSISCAGSIIDCQGTGTTLTSSISATAGVDYFIRIWSPNPAQSGNFNLCVFDPAGATCSNAATILSIPYSATSLNTSGFGNDYTSANTPCASAFHNGPDFVFKYTPASPVCVQIAVTGTGTNSFPGVFVYDACPDVATHCVATATGTSNSATITKIALSGGVTYYIVVDNNSASGPSSIPFNISITSNGSSPANDNYCNGVTNAATALGTLNSNDACGTHTATGAAVTTECASNTAANLTPSCAGYTAGVTGDVWFKFVAGSATTASILVSAGSVGTPASSLAFAVYNGGGGACPGSLANVSPAVCVGPSTSVSATGINLTSGFTYYVRVWSPTAAQAGTFTVCVSNSCNFNDDPCGAIDLYPITPIGTTCQNVTVNDGCASATITTNPPATSACGTVGIDMWYKVTIPASGFYEFRTSQASGSPLVFDPTIEIYRGSCSSLTSISCNDDGNGTFGLYSRLSAPGFIAGETIYIRIWTYANGQRGLINICVFSDCATGIPTPAGDDPCSVPSFFPVISGSCALPSYTSTANDCAGATASPGTPSTCSPAAPNVSGTKDIWFKVIVPSSGQLEFNTKPGSWTDWAMSIYNTNHLGCGSLTEIACNDDYAGNGQMPFISLGGLQAGDTLYIRLYPHRLTFNFQMSGTMSICIDNPCPTGLPPSNDNICGAILLPVGSGVCNYSGPYQNLCSSVTGGVPAPGCAGTTFKDVWFKAVMPASGYMDIDSRQGSLLDGGMAVYTAASAPTSCASTLVLRGCDDNNSSNANMPHVSLSWTPGDTVFIRFWDKGGNNAGTFEMCASDPCPTGSQANDQPCSATPMNIGTYYNGNNSCTNNTAEPIAFPANGFTPSCWSNISVAGLNTVWFSFVAPSNSVIVKTVTGSLSNTQIALYGGACAAPTLIAGSNCNDDFSNCGGTPKSSQITATVTAGTTYFIVVDGYQNLTGSFSLIVLDATLPLPAQPVQDCSIPASVCSQVITVADPGYNGYGSICDLPSSPNYGCFPFSGESNSSWYTFKIASAGTLRFDIQPTSNATNYDWALWRIGNTAFPVGTMAPVCSLLSAHGTSNGMPVIVSCNTSPVTGITGMGSAGTTSSEGTASTNPYCVPIAVNANDQYLLLINNSSFTPVGYSIDFTGASPISYSATSLRWEHASTTVWTNAANWGPCGVIPACGVNAYILNDPNTPWSNPNITTNPQNVNDLLIDLNAKLGIGADTLYVCGNFTQNGSLLATANSVIVFKGTGTQTISGSLTGTNKFGNLVINKPSGSGPVILNSDIEVSGNFTIIGATSVFNINGKNMKVAKNFTNTNGKNSFTGRRLSSVEFNGTADQYFINAADTTYFDRVIINKSGGSLRLGNATSSIYMDSSLTLTNGKIVAGFNGPPEVALSYNNGLNSPALIGGSATSYVQGTFRRRVYRGAFSVIAPLSMDFPIGDSINFYQTANVTWQSATQIPYLSGKFTSWQPQPNPALPGGPTAPQECVWALYDTSKMLDNGYWMFTRTSANTGGKYDLSLHGNSYGNAVSGGHFSPAIADTALDPYDSLSWKLDGQCVYTSTPSNAQRTSMNAGGTFAFNRFYAITQGETPFPITLLYFIANPEKEGVMCKWETASEINNDYFIVERSDNAKDFVPIGRVEGAGNSTQAIFYNLFDKEPPCVEILYYRLKQVDFDGHYSYSDVVAVNCNNRDLLTLYPNPANTEVNVNFYQAFNGSIRIRIVDILGKTVNETEHEVKSGYNVIHLGIYDLPQGVYYLRLINSDDENASKLAKFLKY